ncbi:Cytochrome [Abeliophyllum distichum]|uniref:Cytochrome n=1 Tax=Abeliophyllum distichum TaxID=126358 RepID=A0ABD1UQ04_9LAMI
MKQCRSHFRLKREVAGGFQTWGQSPQAMPCDGGSNRFTKLAKMDICSTGPPRNKEDEVRAINNSVVSPWLEELGTQAAANARRNQFLQGWYHHSVLKDLLGDGIFTVDRDRWKHQRKMSSYEFSTRNLGDFSSGVFKINAAKLAWIVSEAMASNQIIEIQDLFMKSSLDSVFKAFDEASEMTFYRYVDISWPIKQFFNIGSEAKLKNCVKIVDEFVYKVIRNKINQVHKANDNLQDGKMCFSDDTFPDGFSVKKGNLISYQPWAMGRMKSIWGEDAEEFYPQRWLNEHGVRICLGKEFAYRQMKVFAAVSLSVFSFKLSDENKAMNYRTMLTLHIDGGLHLRALTDLETEIRFRLLHWRCSSLCAAYIYQDEYTMFRLDINF